MAHFQTGDCICYRKGGPTYTVQSVLEDGRVLVTGKSGATKLLTRPEDFVRITQCEQAHSSPSLAPLRQVMVPRAREA